MKKIAILLLLCLVGCATTSNYKKDVCELNKKLPQYQMYRDLGWEACEE